MNSPDQHAREHLSAGVDGELAHEELRFLLRRLDHDGELRRTWVSYHVTRDVLRKQLPPLAEGGFAARVMLAIEQETVVSATPRHRWLRWSAGGVIAAGVAVAALMVSQPAGDIHSAHGELTAQATRQSSQGMATPSQQQASDVAVVPSWLSDKAPGLLSEKASATLGAPAKVPFDTQLPPPYGSTQAFGGSRYRTLDNHDGSYLILLDPARQTVPSVSRQSATGGR